MSLLVIPRLPFPYPNAVKENERERYSSLQEFIQSVALPEMQIKLRQGFGRAIRTETDTCVIAILDERAARGGRYLTERASGKILWEDSGKVAFREINRNILCCYTVILGGK